MEIYVYLIIAVLALITETITAMVGFADKLVLIAILTFFLDFKSAIVVAAIYSLFAYSARICFFCKHFDRELFFDMLLYLIPGIATGLFIFSRLESDHLKLIFALFLLGFVAYKAFIKKIAHLKDYNLSKIGLGIGIFIFGMLEASVGAAGPVLAIFLLNYGKKKENFVVFAAAILLVSSIVRLAGYGYYGMLTDAYLPLILILCLVSLAGNYIGKCLLHKMPTAIFQNLVLVILFLIATKEIIM